MQEAYPTGGAMSAVLGTDAGLIEKVCEETEGIVSVANYNCPGQIVITGEEKAVSAAGEALKEAGARRVIPLKVSGPFHCELLKGAGEKLGQALKAAGVVENGAEAKDVIIEGLVKVNGEIDTRRGKKLYDKREAIAKKDQRREAEKEFKVRNL